MLEFTRLLNGPLRDHIIADFEERRLQHIGFVVRTSHWQRSTRRELPHHMSDLASDLLLPVIHAINTKWIDEKAMQSFNYYARAENGAGYNMVKLVATDILLLGSKYARSRGIRTTSETHQYNTRLLLTDIVSETISEPDYESIILRWQARICAVAAMHTSN